MNHTKNVHFGKEVTIKVLKNRIDLKNKIKIMITNQKIAIVILYLDLLKKLLILFGKFGDYRFRKKIKILTENLRRPP